MSNCRLLRQGDVLLTPAKHMEVDGLGEPAIDGRVILALDEATGHHHSVAAKFAALFVLASGARVLRVMQQTALEHQEHAPIDLPAGDYVVTRQKEYNPSDVRQVAD